MFVRSRRFCAVLAASALLGAGCTGEADTPDLPAPVISETASPSSEPANVQPKLVAIGDKSVTTQPKLKPGGNPEAYLVDVLRYTQTLAIKGGVPVPAGGLKYHVLVQGQILACDPYRGSGTVSANESYYAVIWCPTFNGFAVSPTHASQSDVSIVMLAGAFYGNGVAQAVHAGEAEVESSCYHGQIVRQEINADPATWNKRFTEFQNFYEGGVSTNEGLLSGTCRNITS